MRIRIGYNVAWPSAIIFGAALACFVIGGGHKNTISNIGGILVLIAGVPVVIAGVWNWGKEKGYWGKGLNDAPKPPNG